MNPTNKYSIIDCQISAEKHDGVCLSTEYINISSPMQWTCKLGHIWFGKYTNILQGRWCPKCGSNKSNIEEMRRIAEKRGGKCLSEEYINSLYKIEWECEYGHKWHALPGHIKKGHWCPFCNNYTGEKIVYGIFNAIFPDAKPQKTFDWLGRMRLDGYSGTHKLALERQGKQHYKIISAFGGAFSHYQTKTYDQKKYNLCREKGISIIYVPYFIKYKDTAKYIASECEKIGIVLNIDVEKIDYLTLDVYHNKYFDALKEVAISRGGVCLSNYYINATHKLKFMCHLGHTWEAQPNAVKNGGSWCPECKRIKLSTIKKERLKNGHYHAASVKRLEPYMKQSRLDVEE